MKQQKEWALILAVAVALSAVFTSCATQGDTGGGDTANAVNQTAASALSSDYNLEFTARDLDMGYDESTSVKITLSDSGIQVTGSGAHAADSVLTISAAGTYILSGALSDGQIVIDAADTDKIQIVLAHASVTCTNSAAIYVKQADKVFLTLAAGTENTFADAGTDYVQSDAGTTVDGVIFSKEDLAINGSGTLHITAGYKHGIVSKDDLVITGGNINVTASGKGLSGKDCVKIGGSFVLNTQGDAIQSDEGEDAYKGFVYIKDGMFQIDTQGDAVQAETLLQCNGGTYNIITGGGSANASTDSSGNINTGWGQWGGTVSTASTEDTPSAKGLKAGFNLIINGGVYQIDSSDDSFHSNGNLTVTGGEITASTGDDGIHADNDLTISGGTVTIFKSYEGIEGNTVTISDGTINITASDDGMNSAGGSDTGIQGRPGQNAFSLDAASSYIQISGGIIYVDASGDGLDSNGNLYLEGGTVYISGPTSGADGALDYDGSATVTGGTFIATGSSGMVQGFSDTSTQCSILYNFSTSLSGAAVTLTDADGNTLVSWTPEKQYSSVVISAPGLKQGDTYTLTAGSVTTSFLLSAVVTSNGGNMGGGPGRDGGMGSPGGR